MNTNKLYEYATNALKAIAFGSTHDKNECVNIAQSALKNLSEAEATINAVGGEDIIHATLNRLGYGFLGRKKFIDEVMQSLQIKGSLKPDESSVSNNSSPKQETKDDWKGKDFEAAG